MIGPNSEEVVYPSDNEPSVVLDGISENLTKENVLKLVSTVESTFEMRKPFDCLAYLSICQTSLLKLCRCQVCEGEMNIKGAEDKIFYLRCAQCENICAADS